MSLRYFQILVLHFGFVILFISCSGSKKIPEIEKETTIAETVMIRFFQTFGDSISGKLPPIKYKKASKGPVIEQKMDNYLGQTNRLQLTYYIKRFSSLDNTEKYLLAKWAEVSHEAKTGEELYHKMIHYWLLPHTFGHQLTIPENQEIEDFHQFETNIDQYAWYFLVKNGYDQQFNDFPAFLEYLFQETGNKLVIANREVKEILDARSESAGLVTYLFARSWFMLQAKKQMIEDQK